MKTAMSTCGLQTRNLRREFSVSVLFFECNYESALARYGSQHCAAPLGQLTQAFYLDNSTECKVAGQTGEEHQWSGSSAHNGEHRGGDLSCAH